MSIPNEEDRAKRMAQIAKQVTAGEQARKQRKQRNKALVHLGLAVLQKAEKMEVKWEEISPHVVQSELQNCRLHFEEAVRKGLI